MKRKGLVYFGVLTCLVGGYAIYDYLGTSKKAELKKQQDLISELKEEQIQKLKIESSGKSIELRKENDLWLMTLPLQDQANQTASQDFISGIVSERRLAIVKEGSKIDWSQFGLDQPLGTIELQDMSGKVEKFEIGTVKNFEGHAYLRRNSEDKVQLVSSTWFAKLEKKVNDFRDLRLMRRLNSEVTALDFIFPIEKFKLEKREQIWVRPDQVAIRLDQNKIREILAKLNLTEGLEVIHQGKVTQTDLKSWELQQPGLQLQATFQDGSQWFAKFSSGRDRIYRALTSEPELVLKLSPPDGQKFLLSQFDSFRDRKEPFLFNRQKVAKLRLLEKKEKDKIKIVSQDSKEVQDALRSLERMELSSFKVKPTQELHYGLELLDSDDKILLKLGWSKPIKENVSSVPTSVVEMISSAVDYSFSLTEQDLNSLKLNDLFIEKESKE